MTTALADELDVSSDEDVSVHDQFARLLTLEPLMTTAEQESFLQLGHRERAAELAVMRQREIVASRERHFRCLKRSG
jgi:hypothetical protein